MIADTASWAGQTLAQGRYIVLDLLGEGGMAFVYRARDRHLNCDVVIKVPRQAMLEDQEFARRFLREIRSLVRLVHPHIVKVTDFGEQDGVPFAVLQYLGGGSLRDRQPRGPDGRPLLATLSELAVWLEDVAAALDFIHGQQYIHRDIKPENILFDEHGHVYLSDFGIAKAAAGDPGQKTKTVLTQTGTALGTPWYMAPELLLGHACDGRVDQYALAVMVYELLSGRYPFDGPTGHAIFLQQMNEEPPRLRSVGAPVSAAVEQAVLRAMAKKPDRRFADCLSFARAILAEIASAPVVEGSSPALRSTPAAGPRQAETTRVGAVTDRPVSSTTNSQDSQEPVRSDSADTTIRERCPACGKLLRMPVAAQGKRVRCPSCNHAFLATPAEGISAARETARASRTGVETSIEPKTGPNGEPAGSPSAEPEVPTRRFSSRLRAGLLAAGIVMVVACIGAVVILVVNMRPASTAPKRQWPTMASRLQSGGGETFPSKAPAEENPEKQHRPAPEAKPSQLEQSQPKITQEQRKGGTKGGQKTSQLLPPKPKTNGGTAEATPPTGEQKPQGGPEVVMPAKRFPGRTPMPPDPGQKQKSRREQDAAALSVIEATELFRIINEDVRRTDSKIRNTPNAAAKVQEQSRFQERYRNQLYRVRGKMTGAPDGEGRGYVLYLVTGPKQRALFQLVCHFQADQGAMLENLQPSQTVQLSGHCRIEIVQGLLKIHLHECMIEPD